MSKTRIRNGCRILGRGSRRPSGQSFPSADGINDVIRRYASCAINRTVPQQLIHGVPLEVGHKRNTLRPENQSQKWFSCFGAFAAYRLYLSANRSLKKHGPGIIGGDYLGIGKVGAILVFQAPQCYRTTFY